ncbi:MAG: TrbI/VirB10 family protein [Plectolyngbya sp. WJT66-NPBG17]|jgi:hypothetical protein|nr:TrbI/VirB10 family protein [Plectolyngbya sp. WJT66-NPBG17]
MTQTKDIKSSTSEPSLEELANVMGLEFSKNDPVAPKPNPETVASEVDLEEEDDEFDDDEINPEQNRSKVGLHNSGYAKAALVAGGSLLLIVGVMTFYRGVMPKNQASRLKDKLQQEQAVDPTKAVLEATRQSESEAKAELALAKQRDAFSETTDERDGKNKGIGSEKDKKKASEQDAKKQPSRLVTTRSANAGSAPVVRSQPLTRPEPVLRSPVQRQPAIAAPMALVRSRPSPGASAEKTPVDQATEWQRLSALGRFGTVTPGFGASTMIAANNSSRSDTSETTEPSSTSSPQPSRRPSRPSESTTLVASAPSSSAPPLSQYFQGSNVRAVYEQAGLNTQTTPRQPIRALLVGSSTKATTVTPILWAGKENVSGARFLIQSDEPMLDGNNQVAFPAGTQFVVTTKAASSSFGLIDLDVIAVIINGAEFAPPPGAISIRDDNGSLLVGEDHFNRRGRIAKNDAAVIFAGALRQIGKVLNEPRSSTSTSVSGGGITSVTNSSSRRDPNLFGAVLQGGFEELSSILTQRNEEAIDRILNAPQVYQIRAGRSVRVFVNQSITF